MADRYLGRHPGLHRNGYKFEAGRRDRHLSHHISYSNSLFVDLDSCDSWCPLAVFFVSEEVIVAAVCCQVWFVFSSLYSNRRDGLDVLEPNGVDERIIR